MATFKETVRKRRTDGTYPVYIRVTQNRAIDYIKTDMYVYDETYDEKAKEITDPIVKGKCSILIFEYINKLNLKDTANWSVKKVVEFITGGDKVPFYPYCTEYVNALRKEKKDKTAEGYEDAIKSFQKHFTDENITFQDIKKKELEKWIDSLSGTARAKQKYPTNMKAIFTAGRDKYNDYEDNIIVIANDPFYKLEIPKCNKPVKKATDIDSIKILFSAEPQSEREQIAQDVAKLMFFLVGMNTIDMYDMEGDKVKNGKLCYFRHKVRTVREDCYTEVTIRPEIQHLFEKYKGKDGLLFLFKKRYATPKGFYENINKGLKSICEREGIKRMSTNTMRHTWATVAKNKCGASDELIDFCLVHSPKSKMASLYVDIDYSPIDILNDQVLGVLFNSEKVSKEKEGIREVGREKAA